MTISMTKKERTFGWIFLAATPLLIPLLVVFVCQLLRLQPNDALLNMLMFGLNFALTLLIFHRYLWQSGKLSLDTPWKTLRWAGIGFAIYYGASTLTGLLVGLIDPSFANANDANIRLMAKDNFTMMMIGTVLLVPIAEETLYRGLVFGSLRPKNRLLAYSVSMVAFSVLHIISYIGTLSPHHLFLSFLQYLPGGFALAFACDKADSVWASILIHMTINQIAMLSLR